MRYCLSLFLMLVGALPVRAGSNAAAFLDIGVGARATGMAGSFTAISDDATAIYWNPAGIAQLREPEIALSSTGSPLGMGGVLGSREGLSKPKDKHQFASLVYPFERYGSLGIGMIGFGLDEIEHRDESGNLIGSFSDQEDAYMLAYGVELVPEELFVGVDLKLLRQSFPGYPLEASATGFGGDIGLIYLPIRGLKLGFSTQKKTSLRWQNGHSDEIPVRTRLGIAYSWSVRGLMVAGDIEQKRDQCLKVNLGGEFKYSPKFLFQAEKGLGISSVALRAGLSGLCLENRYGPQKGPNLSFGAGIAIGTFTGLLKIDYGADFGYFGVTNRYSLGLVF